mmetsp:Transcript_48467/g.128375  ORF Transcript_48467/g.128375 Transcript_48467/m.128375 type:complete len:223 (+) Transcript_48467:1976-2644(+)
MQSLARRGCLLWSTPRPRCPSSRRRRRAVQEGRPHTCRGRHPPVPRRYWLRRTRQLRSPARRGTVGRSPKDLGQSIASASPLSPPSWPRCLLPGWMTPEEPDSPQSPATQAASGPKACPLSSLLLLGGQPPLLRGAQPLVLWRACQRSQHHASAMVAVAPLASERAVRLSASAKRWDGRRDFARCASPRLAFRASPLAGMWALVFLACSMLERRRLGPLMIQ